MKRDLVFFVTGVSFGMVAGYFLFRALAPAGASSPVAQAPPAAESSPIGLEEEPQFRELDEQEIARLEARAADNPQDAEIRARIGTLYMEAGRYDEALEWIQESLELDPDDLHVRNHLALIYLNKGELEAAVSTYEETLRMSPEDPASLMGLGRIKLYVQRDIAGGLELWEKLMEVAPNSTEAASVRDELEALRTAHPGS